MPHLTDKSIGEDFVRFTVGFDRLSLRWLCVIGLIFSVIFAVIEYWRIPEVLVILKIRFTEFTVFIAGIIITSPNLLSAKQLHLSILFISSICYLNGFLIDWRAEMPSYFLVNYLALYLFTMNTALGYSMKIKIVQTIAVCLMFFFYSTNISIIPSFHGSQSIHVALFGIVSLVIGNMIQRHKLETYKQYRSITSSNAEKS